MKLFPHGIAIQQGSRLLFSDFADNGVMWTGDGPRESRHLVTYPQPFEAPPAVMASLAMWDIDHQTNARLDLTTESITETGFHLVFRTWGDSRIARVRAEWIAFGTIPGEDSWDVP